MKYVVISVLCLGFAIIAACCLIPNKDPEKLKETNPEIARAVLLNLARGMRLHSNLNGGGGHSNFTNDLQSLKRYTMSRLDETLSSGFAKPYEGFLIQLKENPEGDNYKTNFLFIISPAPGYSGDSYCIDKTENITKIK